MKAKWIRVHIARKMSAWTDTIEDAQLRADLKDQIIVTGGCIASMLLSEKVNDFDVYFRTPEIARRVADYYVAKWNETREAKIKKRNEERKGPGRYSVFVPVTIEDRRHDDIEQADSPGFKLYVKSAGIISEQNDGEDYLYFESVDPLLSNSQADFIDAAVGNQPNEALDAAKQTAQELETESKADYHPVFVSANAISLHGRVQLIFRFVGEPERIHDNYDFVHCTNYWTSWGGLTLQAPALEALLAKELRYVGSRYPVCSIFRARKFLDRGWTISAGQLFKIAHQVSKLDLSDYRVLEDQLIGVDTAYFSQVLSALRKGKDDGDHTVDETYLINLIDKVF